MKRCRLPLFLLICLPAVGCSDSNSEVSKDGFVFKEFLAIAQKIEDEYHFLFQCSHYDHLRGPFLDKCTEVDESFVIYDDIEQFRFVLSNEKIQTVTANFAQEAFLFRKKTRL